MEEHPVTIGPKQFTSPVCLGCYRPVAVPEPAEDAETTGLVTNNTYILHIVFLTLMTNGVLNSSDVIIFLVFQRMETESIKL